MQGASCESERGTKTVSASCEGAMVKREVPYAILTDKDANRLFARNILPGEIGD